MREDNQTEQRKTVNRNQSGNAIMQVLELADRAHKAATTGTFRDLEEKMVGIREREEVVLFLSWVLFLHLRMGILITPE